MNLNSEGHMRGSGMTIDGSYFAWSGVVFVSMNYRLGIFGFYASQVKIMLATALLTFQNWFFSDHSIQTQNKKYCFFFPRGLPRFTKNKTG